MSISASIPSDFTPDAGLSTAPHAASSRRLWAGLVRPSRRARPTRGADVLGEWTLGAFSRLRRRRPQWARARAIVARAGELARVSEDELDDAIARARERVVLGRDDPRVVNEAFAVGYEAIRRTLGLSLHTVQVLAALAMAEGCCAELATGEGKTVSAILPAAVDAWMGRGVHVVTVNDYLARRDAQTTGPAFARLGLSVGIIQESSKQQERRAAYAKDVTYAADKQVIFDHLRDRLLAPLAPRLAGLLLDEVAPGATRVDASRGSAGLAWGERVVHRELHAAIIDEADSVLIDEAVTPAIISAPAPHSPNDAHYRIAAGVAARLVQGEHYRLDIRQKQARLTDAGRERVAALSGDLPAFWSGPRRREELLSQALVAREFYRRDDDYVIQEDKVQIVDRSTGRILPGRQWQLGLHQAVEAKEGLAVTPENPASARSSYQQFFARYKRLSGMTGTAREVAAEMWRWYRLPIVRIPTHKPVIRTRAPDRFCRDEADKFQRVAGRVRELHAEGRPVLVGTRSVASSQRLAELLRASGVACEVLNAHNEAREAEIIAGAGREGAVTVATNMAGRGTDIAITPQVRELGGLAVVATERHDEARVDRQLFGRAGRQGDPGSAEAFVAFDDQLIKDHAPKPLLWLARATGLAPARRALWWFAQTAAGRRWAAIRANVAQAESWYDQAMHQLSR